MIEMIQHTFRAYVFLCTFILMPNEWLLYVCFVSLICTFTIRKKNKKKWHGNDATSFYAFGYVNPLVVKNDATPFCEFLPSCICSQCATTVYIALLFRVFVIKQIVISVDM